MFTLRRLGTRSINLSLLERLQFTFGTIKPYNLPDLGEKIKEATVKKIYVKEGDHVEEFTTIADVATDKLFTQIPSPYTGKIHKIHHKEEEACLVGQVFIEIEVDEEPSKSTTTNTSQPTKKATTEPKAESHSHKTASKPATVATTTTTLTSHACPIWAAISENNEHIASSPATRSIAREHKIDLSKITNPTGKNGIISKTDILLYIQNGPSQAPSTKSTLSAATSVVTEKTTVKMNEKQKENQKRATLASKVPHLFLSEEFDVTAIYELRKRIEKPKISFSSILLKAFSLALREYPLLNSLYNPAHQYQYTLVDTHNIALPIGSPSAPNGVTVVNIKDVQTLSISEIQTEIKRLTQSNNDGQLLKADISDATISFVNTGNVGGTFMDPLIDTPQTTVVGLGRVTTQPRLINSVVLPRKIMNVSFGCDHRVIDGATVTKFSNRWRQYLEDPTVMLLNLK